MNLILDLYSRIIDAINVGFWYWAGLFIGGCPIYINEIILYMAFKGWLRWLS